MTRPTKQQLQRLVDLRENKRSLESEARSFDSEISLLETKVKDHLDAIGKDAAKINGFQCTRSEGRASVSWKDELVGVVGAEAVAEIAANAPRCVKLTVSPT